MGPITLASNHPLTTGNASFHKDRDDNPVCGYTAQGYQVTPTQQGDNLTTSSHETVPKAHKTSSSIEERNVSFKSHKDNAPKLEANQSKATPEDIKSFTEVLNPSKDTDRDSLFGEGDITISDPQFQYPPSKPKTLSGVINVFTTSFKNLFFEKQQGPDVDRSDRVQTIDNYLRAPTRVAFLTGTALTITALAVETIILLDQLLPEHSRTLRDRTNNAVIWSMMVVPLSVGAFVGGAACLAASSANVLTSAVSAAADTYEQLTKEEQPKTPEEMFLEKYHRMEELLLRLKNKIDQKVAYYNSIQFNDKVEEKKAKREVASQIKDMKAGAKDIESWLERAEKQKQIIDQTTEMAEIVNARNPYEKPIAPYDWLNDFVE